MLPAGMGDLGVERLILVDAVLPADSLRSGRADRAVHTGTDGPAAALAAGLPGTAKCVVSHTFTQQQH